jgi:hypothetical protein
MSDANDPETALRSALADPAPALIDRRAREFLGSGVWHEVQELTANLPPVRGKRVFSVNVGHHQGVVAVWSLDCGKRVVLGSVVALPGPPEPLPFCGCPPSKGRVNPDDYAISPL